MFCLENNVTASSQREMASGDRIAQCVGSGTQTKLNDIKGLNVP
jgi:hypothetical protein